MSDVSSGEAAPKTMSNAVQYEAKTPALRRYLTFYSLASLGIALLWGAVLGLLLPLHVQQLEFARLFTGADANVSLEALKQLQARVSSGAVSPTADQERLLGLLKEFNTARATGLSFVTSVGVVLAMLCQPVIGLLSDRTKSRWGRRAPWVAAGGVAGAALICLMPIVPSVAVLVIVWSLVNLAGNLAQGPLGATVPDRVPEDRIGAVSGITGLAAYLGAIIGAIAAGALFSAIGLGAYYPIAVVIALATFAFVVFARDNSSQEMPTKRLRFSEVLKSYGVALRDRDYRWAWVAKVLLYAAYGISSGYAVYMLQSYIQPSLSTDAAAQMAPLLQFASLPFTLIAMFVAGRWSDKVHRRKPFVIGAAAIMGVAFLVPFVSPTLPAMFAQVIITGIGYGTFIVVDQALFIDVLPDKEAAGRDLGLSSLGQNLGQAVGPIVAGIVVSLFAGEYGPLWLASGVLVIISAIAVIPIRRVR